ncbi:hypothetical protein PAMP_016991 [Pampus punctatissimus]
MIQQVTYDLFVVSLVVLLLVLVILLVLCWTLKRSRSRKFTELQLSTGQPACILTIRTEQDQVYQLLDHLLERVLVQVEPRAEPEEEPGEQPEGERADSGSDPEISAAASHPGRAVNVYHNKLWKWITFTGPPPATPPPAPGDQDQTNDLEPRGSDASLASCSASWQEQEERHEETQL